MTNTRPITQIIIAFVALLAVCFLSGNAYVWWDSNYQYRKQITITNNSGGNVLQAANWEANETTSSEND